MNLALRRTRSICLPNRRWTANASPANATRQTAPAVRPRQDRPACLLPCSRTKVDTLDTLTRSDRQRFGRFCLWALRQPKPAPKGKPCWTPHPLALAFTLRALSAGGKENDGQKRPPVAAAESDYC